MLLHDLTAWREKKTRGTDMYDELCNLLREAVPRPAKGQKSNGD